MKKFELATGADLDAFGDLLSKPRLPVESDAGYSDRLRPHFDWYKKQRDEIALAVLIKMMDEDQFLSGTYADRAVFAYAQADAIMAERAK